MQARSSHSMRYAPVIIASFQNFSVDSRPSETFLDSVELDYYYIIRQYASMIQFVFILRLAQLTLQDALDLLVLADHDGHTCDTNIRSNRI